MDENAADFFRAPANGLTPGMIGRGRVPQDDVFAIKRAVTLANRHSRLPRVEPHE